MVMEVLWGEMSPNKFQRIASLFLEDVLQVPNLDLTFVKQFARMGTFGKCPDNVWRDMMTLLPVPQLPLHRCFLPLHSLQLTNFWRTMQQHSL